MTKEERTLLLQVLHNQSVIMTCLAEIPPLNGWRNSVIVSNLTYRQRETEMMLKAAEFEPPE